MASKKSESENGETDLRKLTGDERVAEALRQAGMNPEEMSSLAYTIWSPWKDDKDHVDDPIMFTGTYEGYKLIEKEISGKLSVFGGFLFSESLPASRTDAPWIVLNKILLGDLARVLPGTKVTIIYAGSKPNAHGGQTRDVRAMVDKKDRKERVSARILPPMNQDIKMLSGSRAVGTEEVPDDAFGA